MNRLFRILTVVAASHIVFAMYARAQDYPTHTIKIVSPFSAGGPTDTLSRMIGQRLNERWGQAVIVENKPGAGGNIGAEFVAKSVPDGYTLLLVANSHAINASVYSKLPFDTLRDFAPIINVASGPFVLTVHPSVPAASIAELIVYAKSNPGKLSYASAGTGTANHLAGELFKTLAGVNIVHIPYKGSPAATNDVLSGQVSMIFNNMISATPYMNSSRLRALAVTGPKRTASFPNLPTVAESGLPGFNVTGWYGILGPAGVPPEIVRKLNTEIDRIIQEPDMQIKLQRLAVESVGGSAESFAAFIKSEIEKWASVVKTSGARAN